MNATSIRTVGLGKYYKRYASRWTRLAEWLHPARAARHEPHWALREISFSIRAGESVGIVGQNGAGKSTLLKLITGTTRPSAGSVETAGRVAALLELGMGFHPDFTGRQNIHMAGQLLGFSREDIAPRIPEIEAFADIGDYVDQPVRTYSSGMQVRLAFAVATCIRPDVLIIDEALSVGDIFFQQKCFDRIRSFKHQGTTLLFVTHSMGSIYALCDRAMLLDHGRLICDADPKTVIDLYQRKELHLMNASLTPARSAAGGAATPVSTRATSENAAGQDDTRRVETADIDTDFRTNHADIEAVSILQHGQPVGAVVSGTEIAIAVTLRARTALSDPHIGFQIRNARGESIFQTNTYCMRERIGPMPRGSIAQAEFSMPVPLAPGDYSVTVGAANEGVADSHFQQSLVRRHASAKLTVLQDRSGMIWSGVCNLSPSVRVSRSDEAIVSKPVGGV